MEININPSVTFSREEIIKAIDSTNPHKGIGPDGFCGLIINQDAELKKKVALGIANCLN